MRDNSLPQLRVVGSDAPEIREIHVGYMPLSDCASVLMAPRLGYDRKHGIRIVLHRQPSWATLRDRLLGEELHAAHLLHGLTSAIELGVGGPRCAMAILMTLNQNGQAITLSRALHAAGVRNGAALQTLIARHARQLVLAHTFPTGTHALWLYYWLAAHGIDPLSEVITRTVPPPLMVERLRDDGIDGFSAGEPWSALAALNGPGYTLTTSQAIWPDHPEKVLATRRAFVERCPNAARALLMAVLETARHLETSADWDGLAQVLAEPGVCGLEPLLIASRLRGDYHDGMGGHWHDPHGLRLFGEGAVTFPYLSDAMWFMTQHRRWGLLDEAPDYHAVAAAMTQVTLYREAASALGIGLPTSDSRSSRLFDGRLWNGEQPESYAMEANCSRAACTDFAPQ